MKLGLAAADQRQYGGKPRHFGKFVEEIIFRTEHDRRAQNHRIGQDPADGLLGPAFGAGIVRLRFGVGAKRGYLGHADALGPTGLGDGAGAEILNRVKSVAAGFEQDADAIDHMIRALDGSLDRIAVTQIGLHSSDLSNAAQGLKMEGQIGTAHRDPDPVAAPRKGPHHMAANKT